MNGGSRLCHIEHCPCLRDIFVAAVGLAVVVVVVVVACVVVLVVALSSCVSGERLAAVSWIWTEEENENDENDDDDDETETVVETLRVTTMVISTR